MSEAKTLTKKDLKSDQEVRWCPGCGDYAILNTVQGVLAKIGVPKEDLVVVSGIGCSSRFPYYMGTYGLHSIHGRAPAFATAIKTANPELSVWMVTGDGDALSIGGNHLIHMLRRTPNVKILLFNNEIYGLTKGQYSPTSPVGLRTKSTPAGSVDNPFNPLALALGAGATFVARTIDTHTKHLAGILEAAAAHKGTAFIEIYQNCVIFNDGCFDDVAAKNVRDDKMLDLRPGQPMVFGKDSDKGVRVEGFETRLVSAEEASIWDPTVDSPGPAFTMAQMDSHPELPRPMGILRQVEHPVYEELVHQQIDAAKEKKGIGHLRDLIYSGETWEVE
jgi:2-oxoglutarate ferredoxin oxidoreductase subunit beta